MWIVSALVAAALWAASNLIDAILLDGRVRHASSLLILTGFTAGLPGALLLVSGRASPLMSGQLVVALGAGLLGLLVYYPYFRALGVVAAVDVLLLWNMAPVMVAVGAHFVLHETLGAQGVVGAVLLVVASSLACLRTGYRRPRALPILWMGAASVLVAWEATAERSVYNSTSFLTGFAWMSVGAFVSAVIVYAIDRPARREVSRLVGRIGWWVVLNQALDLLAVVARGWAISHGPVSVVHALGSLQPVFLLGYVQLAPRLGGRGQGNFRQQVVRVLIATLLAAVGIGMIGSET